MNTTLDPLMFDEWHPEYWVFCNDAPFPFTLGDTVWPTVYHYLISRRFGYWYHTSLLSVMSVDQIHKLIGRMQQDPLLRLEESLCWRVYLDEDLHTALHSKFRQNTPLATLLVQTGEHPLIYIGSHQPAAGNSRRQDLLGRTLMRVRRELANHAKLESARKLAATDYESKVSLVDVNRDPPVSDLERARRFFHRRFYVEAVTASRTAIRTGVGRDGWFLLGLSLLRLERLDEAHSAASRMLAIDSSDGDALDLMASILRAQGRTAEAGMYERRLRLIDLGYDPDDRSIT